MKLVNERWRGGELRDVVAEASLSLARMDVDRLEELAFRFRALNRELGGSGGEQRAEIYRQAREASREIEMFGRVLKATRSNLDVIKRLRERRQRGLEYEAGGRPGWTSWAIAVNGDGND